MKASDLVEVPKVPNFLLMRSKGMPDIAISIAAFTDSELKSIAKEWTKNLLARAAEVRSNQNVTIK